MTDERKTERFNMLFSASELADIDAWAAEHGFKSRAEAIRTLITRGMDKWQPYNLNDLAIVAMRSIDAGTPMSRSQHHAMTQLVAVLQDAITTSTTQLYDALERGQDGG